MIINETIDIFVIPRTLNHYINKGYKAEYGKTITVKISDLPIKSNAKIKVKCDVCGEENLSYQKYTKNISNGGYYSCSQRCSMEKYKKTCLDKYGIDHYVNIIKRKTTCLDRYGKNSYFETDEFKEKFKITSLEKYGESYPMKSILVQNILKKSLMDKYGVENSMYLDEIKDKVKKSKILHKIISPDEMVSELCLYKRIIRKLTYKYKKELFENWNGYDYYDKKYIKDNMSLIPTNRSRPTIDHKISVLYGFLNNISPEIIGDISNLCITKKHINSTKKEKIEEVFNI